MRLVCSKRTGTTRLGPLKSSRDGPTNESRCRLLGSQRAQNDFGTLLERLLTRLALWKRDDNPSRQPAPPRPASSELPDSPLSSVGTGTKRSVAIERASHGQQAQCERGHGLATRVSTKLPSERASMVWRYLAATRGCAMPAAVQTARHPIRSWQVRGHCGSSNKLHCCSRPATLKARLVLSAGIGAS